jgi:hypothetical protein
MPPQYLQDLLHPLRLAERGQPSPMTDGTQMWAYRYFRDHATPPIGRKLVPGGQNEAEPRYLAPGMMYHRKASIQRRTPPSAQRTPKRAKWRRCEAGRETRQRRRRARSASSTTFVRRRDAFEASSCEILHHTCGVSSPHSRRSTRRHRERTAAITRPLRRHARFLYPRFLPASGSRGEAARRYAQ